MYDQIHILTILMGKTIGCLWKHKNSVKWLSVREWWRFDEHIVPNVEEFGLVLQKHMVDTC